MHAEYVLLDVLLRIVLGMSLLMIYDEDFRPSERIRTLPLDTWKYEGRSEEKKDHPEQKTDVQVKKRSSNRTITPDHLRILVKTQYASCPTGLSSISITVSQRLIRKRDLTLLLG
jgi:hypothetical protein